MLALQNYLRTHEDWETSLAEAPYFLNIKRDGNLILFKYNQIKSDFGEEIVRESRGIILEDGSFDIVAYPFNKFFNLGEFYADEIDWNTATATEKIDGSIIKIAFYKDKWIVATNGSINAYTTPLDSIPYSTFGELFDAAAINAGLDYDRLDPHYTYVFELISPYNKVVISYDKPDLYFLMARDNRTFEEVDVEIGVKKPKSYLLSSRSEYETFVASMGSASASDIHEGIVVKDSHGRRVKIKTQLYFELHHVASNGNISVDYLYKLVHENDTDEFLVYFPEYADKVAEFRKSYENMIATLEHITQEVSETKAQLLAQYSKRVAKKQFAQMVADLYLKSLWFDVYAGRNIVAYVDELEGPRHNQMMKLFFGE